MLQVRTPAPALDLRGVEVLRPTAVDAALALLSDPGADAAPLAGATWIMRAAQIGAPLAPVQVALAGIEELRGVTVTGDAVRLGALTTHAGVAAVDAGPAFRAVGRAGAISAFPAVRHMATVGGNVATVAFAEADLVPALLASEALVELATPNGTSSVPLGAYLEARGTGLAAELVTAVTVPLADRRRAAFERLTVRGGGEYAIASAAVSLDLAADGTVTGARIAAGAVEATSRLLAGAAQTLLGAPVTDASMAAAGAAAAAEVRPRDGRDAPGWYRVRMLDVLVRRALRRIQRGDVR